MSKELFYNQKGNSFNCFIDYQILKWSFNQKFLLRIDCKSVKQVLRKDIQNIVSKQIFIRRQVILSVFDFEIEFIKNFNNYFPNFLISEFLQCKIFYF